MKQIIGKQLIRIQETDSTNNYANRYIAANSAIEGTVFLAYSQTNGRGQVSNRWESEKGKNLTFSIVLTPHFLEIRKQFMLSKVVTLGICSALSAYIDGAKIKWPNDIYVGRKKICGILIENSVMNNLLSHSVVGIGINVNQSVFKSDAPNPVSLFNLTGNCFDTDLLLNKVLEEINRHYDMLKNSHYELLDKLFQEVLFQNGKEFEYQDAAGIFKGTIQGVNEIGQLIIQRNDGIKKEYHFKEVEYII